MKQQSKTQSGVNAQSGCKKRIVRRFRIEDWPDASDGIEIAGRIRIGLFAGRVSSFPSWFYAGRCLQRPAWQIRIGRIGIGYTREPYCGRNDLTSR